MSFHYLIVSFLASSLAAVGQEESPQDTTFKTRQEIFDSFEVGSGHQIEYRHGDEQKLVTWANLFRGQNKCSVAIFEYDTNEHVWRRTFTFLFPETREIRVEFRRNNVLLRNDNGTVIYDDLREPRRFKGIELYSWKNQEGAWVFALLDGTNRNKTEDEIRNSPDRYVGLAALKERLNQLAIGETVMWNPRQLKEFPLPDGMSRREVIEAAQQAGISIE